MIKFLQKILKIIVRINLHFKHSILSLINSNKIQMDCLPAVCYQVRFAGFYQVSNKVLVK